MKIRYQNGQAAEAITVSRTESTMRVALRGTDDVLELRRLGGTWMTEECEPVAIEYTSRRTPGAYVSEEDCICPAELAAHLVRLLLTDSSEDGVKAPGPSRNRQVLAAARVA
jgi:hypothetical protein